MLTAGLVFSVASIQAQTLILTGTVVSSMPDQLLSESFPNSGTGGYISSWAVNDPTLDPYGLMFIYQVTNSGPSAVGDVELNGFTSGQIVSTATYSAETGLTLTGALTPSTDGNLSTFNMVGGNAATFEYGSGGGSLPNTPGNNVSYFLVIDSSTGATPLSNYGREDGGSFTAYGSITTAAVPEPSSLALLAGFAGLFGLMKYRRAATVRG